MNKKLKKWLICGGVFIGGIAFVTLIDAPDLAPIVTAVAVGLSFMINTDEQDKDENK
ncbi:MAG: hypothetical protein QNL77_09930 [Akkermansiaceae bacterium]